MDEWYSVDEVLDFAIGKEQEAVDFYTALAGKMTSQAIADLFTGFAKQEMGHKEKLSRVKEGKFLLPAEKKVPDLKIADYLVDMDPSPEMDYQEALILAMDREKAAFKLYTDLEALAPSQELKDTFRALAQEEARHKLRLETEYDEQVLQDN